MASSVISISRHRLQRVACFGYRVYDIGTMEVRVFFGGKFLPLGDPEKRSSDLYKGFFMVKHPKVAILEGTNVELPISRP
jgi:hypothetical protein